MRIPILIPTSFANWWALQSWYLHPGLYNPVPDSTLKSWSTNSFVCVYTHTHTHTHTHNHVIYTHMYTYIHIWAFPGSSVGKESLCQAGDPSWIPGLGRFAGEGIGYPPQYSWASLVAQLVKNLPAMQETWLQSIQSVGSKESDMTEWLIYFMYVCMYVYIYIYIYIYLFIYLFIYSLDILLFPFGTSLLFHVQF